MTSSSIGRATNVGTLAGIRTNTFRYLLCVLVLVVCTVGHSFDERVIPDQTELEISVLESFLGNERVAKRYHRAIVRYREMFAKLEEKRAKQKDDRPVSIGNVAPLFEMNKLMKRRTPARTTIDFEDYSRRY